MKPVSVLFIGSLSVDVIASLREPKRIEIDAETVEKLVCVTFASKTELDGLRVMTGGSAANSAIAAGTLGAKTALVSAVGGDSFAGMMLDDLKRNGVDASGVRRFANDSSTVGIILLAGEEKSALINRGAFAKLSEEDLDPRLVEKADVVVLTSLSSVANYALFIRAIRLARKFGKKIVFAPSITMLKARHAEFTKLHQHFDAVVMNAEEARFYTGRKELLSALHALPGRVKVVTDAANGAYAQCGGETFRASAPKVRVKDTTGAGDTFTGAFVTSYYSTGNLKESLRTAAAAAALELTTIGAHSTEELKKTPSFRRRVAVVHIHHKG